MFYTGDMESERDDRQWLAGAFMPEIRNGMANPLHSTPFKLKWVTMQAGTKVENRKSELGEVTLTIVMSGRFRLVVDKTHDAVLEPKQFAVFAQETPDSCHDGEALTDCVLMVLRWFPVTQAGR